MNIEFYQTRINFKRLQVALLKTAYLQCFEKYGYSFIMEKQFDVVREQIRNPDRDLYPTQFWFIGPFKEEQVGVHFVKNHGLECIMSIFSLKSLQTRVFGAVLPVKFSDPIEVVAGFHASIGLEVEYTAEFERFDAQEGYLTNIDNIKSALTMMKTLQERK